MSVPSPRKQRKVVRGSIWKRVTDPTVLVAFFAGASGVIVAWLGAHSFIDKTMCRIKTEQMTPLGVDYANLYGAYSDYLIALGNKSSAEHDRGKKFERAIIDNAVALRDKLRAGGVITEEDLKKWGELQPRTISTTISRMKKSRELKKRATSRTLFIGNTFMT